MTYETDNVTSKKNLKEGDLARISEMKSNIPKIEKLLSEFGELTKEKITMWYTGFGWFLKVKSKPTVYMIIQYSDERFGVKSYRFCITPAEAKKKYPTGPTPDDMIVHRDDFFEYEVCRFTDWITLKDVGEVIRDFVAFIPGSGYSCEMGN